MSSYRGVESLDENERKSQHALTGALWSKLIEQGIGKRARGRIEAVFFASDARAAEALVAAMADDGWTAECEPTGERFVVRVTTPEAEFTREAFLELADIMMVAAKEHSCVFDGLEVDVQRVRRRPWWQIW